jgi:hypothetical protein
LCWNYQNKEYTRPAPPCLWLQSCIWVIQMPSSQIVSPKKRAVFFSLVETSFPSATSTRYPAANCNTVTLKSFFLSPGLDPCRKIQKNMIQIPRAVLRPIPNPSLNFFTFCRFYGLPWTLNTYSLIDSSRSPFNTNQSSPIPLNSSFQKCSRWHREDAHFFKRRALSKEQKQKLWRGSNPREGAGERRTTKTSLCPCTCRATKRGATFNSRKLRGNFVSGPRLGYKAGSASSS